LDSIPDTIYFKDTESRFTRINSAQTLFLGLDSAEKALGKTDADFFITPHLAQTLLEQEQSMMRSGEPVIDEVEEHLSKDGQVRWMSSTKVPIRERQGRIVGMVGVSRDITERKRAEFEMQAQKALFENLVAVARATTAMPSLEATLQNALRVSAQLTGAMRGSLFLLNEAGQVTHSIRSEGEEMEQARVELVGQVMRNGLAGWVRHYAVSALIADTETDDRWMPSPDVHYQARSVLAVPILHSGMLLGIMTLLHSEPGQFTHDHLRLMEAAADQMALALRNARMLDETQVLAEQMYMLNHISQAALAATTLDELYQALADRIGELFGSDACQITYWNEVRQEPISKASSDPAWRTGGQALLSRVGAETVTRLVLAQGKALAIDSVPGSEVLDGKFGEPAVRSLLGLPLIAHDRKLGTVILAYETPHAFSETEVSLGERVGRQVALALSNALLYREAAEERERLQALIDSSRDGVALLSADRRILICNEPTLRMLELPGGPADWVGRPLRVALMTLARYAPEVMRAGLSEIRRVEQGDEQPSEGEYRLGQQFVHWLNLPVKGEALGRLLVFRDVTEERALEKMRDDLAHMMVHDLRSPLSAIIGATDLLAKKMAAMGDEDQELAVIVRDSAERMLGLVSDILNVSQLEAGQMPVEHNVVAMAPLVAEVLQLQSGAIERKHLQVEGPGHESEMPPVWGDLRLLVRVLQNLIGNAVKFTPTDGTLQVKARVDGHFLEVEISNSGPGIPLEIKSRLFTKFVRGNQREHGSGLGLAFCHLVVEAHGGHIWAESEPGQGATFKFTVPLYEPGN
jgi:PAS domain S-box-containing protein